MNSCFTRPAWPNGNFSISARASLTEVTFKRKTGPVCVWRIHHWSILPARYNRSVAGPSFGKISFIFSGVSCLVLNVLHIQFLPSIRDCGLHLSVRLILFLVRVHDQRVTNVATSQS